MTKRTKKLGCPYCPTAVRQLGKHINQKHPGKPYAVREVKA